MIAFDDEVISCAAGTVKSLTAATIAPSGSGKAIRAVVQNSETSDTDVVLRFNSTPVVTSPVTGIEIDVGETITIDGYDNLVNARFLLKGGTTASLYVAYYR